MTAPTNVAMKTETHRSNTVILTTPQAALYLGLAVSTLNKWRCFGAGPKFLKLGRAVRYRREDLDSFLMSRQLGSTSEY
jgi:predicted DNA-binding transcriptional regulator AlpA